MSRNGSRPPGRESSLDEQPWWTLADQAELELLVHEVVRAAFIHKERCATCRRAGGILYCVLVGEAIAAVTDWRGGRILKSKAAWLRARQQAREELLVA